MRLRPVKTRSNVPAVEARLAHLRPILRLLVVLCALGALGAVDGGGVALLLAPVALLAIVLPFGRYPGENVLHRIARRAAVRRPTVRALPPRAPRSLGSTLSALAVPGSERGPPLAAGLI